MIFDGENMFFKDKTLAAETATSDVIKMGEGESSQPMKCYAQVKDGNVGGGLDLVFQTAKTAAFSDPVTLCTCPMPAIAATGIPASMCVPLMRGNEGYIRVKSVSTYSTGKLTAGLVLDDDIK